MCVPRLLIALIAWTVCLTNVGQSDELMDFWGSYDARAETLDVEIIKKWDTGDGHFELVRFRLGELTGTNKTASPRIAAYYGIPAGAKSVPGIVHIHGGGQTANKRRVADWVKLGYACVSINWGAKVLEQADTPNTDWDGLAAGFIRSGIEPSDGLDHHNLVRPDANTLFKEPHLLNSSWNLIALSARRALTFLEQQPNVDGAKLGVEGHSMGGRSTVLTAIDDRIKAAAPSVGGSGYLHEDLWGLPGSARRMTADDGLDLYTRTVSAQAYWPHIKAPTLFLGATNDFNSPTESVIKGMQQLPKQTRRIQVWAPHLNHRFTAETDGARFMWMDAHLKGEFSFPRESSSELKLKTADHIPELQVVVDDSVEMPIEKVEIFYGYARDPRIRFWRSATVTRTGKTFSGKCPVFDPSEPLFAFANITYKMSKALPARAGVSSTDLLTVSSEYQIAYPDDLQKAGVQATEKPQRVVDDFAHEWQDWYRLNAANPHHWFYATRKVVDPAWMGPLDGKLALDVITSAAGNQIAIGIEVNAWQSYTGRQKDIFHAIVDLPIEGVNEVNVGATDFTNASGESLVDWDEATELSFTPANRVIGNDARKSQLRQNQWQGSSPQIRNLRWEGGEFISRPYPHQPRGEGAQVGVAFDDEFQTAIADSVELEAMDAGSSVDGRVYLTKEMATSTSSFWRVMNDKSVGGSSIRIGGTTYRRGLGVHAESKLTFALDGKFKAFHVVPGPDDSHRGLLTMKILLDEKEVFELSSVRSIDERPQQIVDVPVQGAKILTLIVTEDGDRGGDHASWADAYLVR